MTAKIRKPSIGKKGALVTKKKAPITKKKKTFSPGLKNKPKFSVIILFFLVVALAIPGIYLIYNSMAAAPSEVTVGPCTVKSEVPKLNSITVSTANICKSTLPKIGNILKDKNSNTKIETSCKNIKITIKPKLNQLAGYALPVRCEVWLDGNEITKTNKDPEYIKEILAHEMTHLATFRQDRLHNLAHTTWLQEGLADYVKFRLTSGKYWKENCTGREKHYRSGYACASSFLRFTQKYLWSNAIFETAKAAKNANIRFSFDSTTDEDKLFFNYTGAKTGKIYEECRTGGPKGKLTKFCKGGAKTY